MPERVGDREKIPIEERFRPRAYERYRQRGNESGARIVAKAGATGFGICTI